MGEVLLSDVAKCCLRYDLVIGCAIYVTVEVYLWAIMSLASAYTELKLIENHEAVAFRNFAQNSTYYVTAFGSPSDEVGRAVICKLSCNSLFSVFPWCTVMKKIPLENRFSPLAFCSNSNRHQRDPCGRLRALLYFFCDSSNRNFGGTLSVVAFSASSNGNVFPFRKIWGISCCTFISTRFSCTRRWCASSLASCFSIPSCSGIL